MHHPQRVSPGFTKIVYGFGTSTNFGGALLPSSHKPSLEEGNTKSTKMHSEDTTLFIVFTLSIFSLQVQSLSMQFQTCFLVRLQRMAYLPRHQYHKLGELLHHASP